MTSSIKRTEPTTRDRSESPCDVCISYAEKDKSWSEALATRLRNHGIRVLSDPAGATLRQRTTDGKNDGDGGFRKLVPVWSEHYFTDRSTWKVAETFAAQRRDTLDRERPLVPVMLRTSRIRQVFKSLPFIDFRNEADFELHFYQLIEALDVPKRQNATGALAEFQEQRMDRKEMGLLSQKKGDRFEDEVARLYVLHGFNVQRDLKINGVQIDLVIEKDDAGLAIEAIVECKDTKITKDHRDQIVTQRAVIQQLRPACRWIVVSSKGFAAETRAALESLGISCVLYRDLLRKLVKLDLIVHAIVDEYERHVEERWAGDAERFIRPQLRVEGHDAPVPAVSHLAQWVASEGAALQLILGDLGTGKTTLSRFFAYQLALCYLSDPSRHPAPVLIPLKEMRTETSLESIVNRHFAKHGVPSVDFFRFSHLLKTGRVVLFFDAFDEMVERVDWDISAKQFHELRKSSSQWGGKTLITCRPHYFENRQVEVEVIGRELSLSQTQTTLMRDTLDDPNVIITRLCEFSKPQIKEYLLRVRPETAEHDWQTMLDAHELDNLAQTPLLLELIVRHIDELSGRHITRADLYRVCANKWVQREKEEKDRWLLSSELRLRFTIELAWELWTNKRRALDFDELLRFIERLGVGELKLRSDAQRKQVAHELHAAAFLRRDDGEAFTWVHRSFGEYFLAEKVYLALSRRPADLSVLEARLFDRNAIGFLALLDVEKKLVPTLQSVLTAEYSSQISETAIDLLYWIVRIKAGMETRISDLEKLRSELADSFPTGIQLPNAKLRELVLEGATLRDANLIGAHLEGAKLGHVRMIDVNLQNASLTGVGLEHALLENVNVRDAELTSVLWTGAILRDVDLRGATFDTTAIAAAKTERVFGVQTEKPREQTRLQPIVQLGSPSELNSVAWSNETNLVATAGQDGVIRIYNAAGFRLLRLLEGHDDVITSIAFNGDGTRLASASLDEKIRIWSIMDGKLLHTLKGHRGGVWAVGFDVGTGLLGSAGGDKTIRLWDLAKLEVIRTFKEHRGVVSCVAFNINGRTLASGSHDGTVMVWDKLKGTLEGRFPTGGSPVLGVAFNPSGSVLAAGCEDQTIKVLGAANGKVLRVFEGHHGPVRSVVFEPNGVLLFSGSADRSVKLWDVDGRFAPRTLEGHKLSVTSVSADPQGRGFVSASSDRTAKVWEAKSGQLLHTIEGHQSSVSTMEYNSRYSYLAAGYSDGTIRFWDAQGGQLMRVIQGHQHAVTKLALAPNGPLLISSAIDATLHVCCGPDDGASQRSKVDDMEMGVTAFDVENERVFYGAEGNSVKIRRIKDNVLLFSLVGHGASVTCLDFNPRKDLIVSGSVDSTLKLWDASEGELRGSLQGQQSVIRTVTIDETGQTIAAGTVDGLIQVWEAKSGKMLHLLKGHGKEVLTLAFHPDGSTVFSGSADHSVRLWDVGSGKLLSVLEGHLGSVHAIAFGAGGRRLITAGSMGRLQIWDIDRNEALVSLYAFGAKYWLAVLPDGRFGGTPDALRYLRYTEEGTLRSRGAEELVKQFYAPDAVQEVLAR